MTFGVSKTAVRDIPGDGVLPESNKARSPSESRGAELITDTILPPAISVVHVLLAVFAYLLLVTDVVRSKPCLDSLPFAPIEPNIFALDGPRALSPRNLTRLSEVQADSPSFLSTLGSAVSGQPEEIDIESASFKFTPSSYGMRAIWLRRGNLMPHWPACLTSAYDTACDDILPPATAFAMLEDLVTVVADNANDTTSYKTILSAAGIDMADTATSVGLAEGDAASARDYLSTLPQRVRFAMRAKARWLDNASPLLSRFILDHQYWLSVWGTHFDDLNATQPGLPLLCADEWDRPLLCEKTWADFQRLAPMEGIDKLWDHISETAAELQTKFPDKTLDVTILETEADPLSIFGGAVVVAHKIYNMAVIFRVRSCLAAASSSSSPVCTTLQILDHRFEGRVLYTDVVDWKYITWFLRGTAQIYMIVRLVFLGLACYHAVPVVKREGTDSSRTGGMLHRLSITVRLFMAIPCQVVVYGSMLPVLFYAAAHLVDGVVHYHIDAPQVESFSVLFSLPVGEIIRLLAVHTRSVWLAASVVRILVFIETSGSWTPVAGVTGFRGFLLPLIASIALSFGLRNESFEDSRVLEGNEVEPSATYMVIRAETIDSWKLNAGGVYQDLISLMLVLLAFVAVKVLLHGLRRCFVRDSSTSWWPRTTCWSHCEVPYAAGYLWDPSCLVVAWEDDLLCLRDVPRADTRIPVTSAAISSDDVRRLLADRTCISADISLRTVLMNITFLSDPWNYAAIHFGNTRVHLYTVRNSNGSGDSKGNNDGDQPPPRHVLHPYALPRFIREFELQSKDVTLVRSYNAAQLTWTQLIRCR